MTERKIIYKLEDYIYPNLYTIDWENCNKDDLEKWVKENHYEEFISLDNSAETEEIEVGAIIVATGFDIYEPYDGEYGLKLTHLRNYFPKYFS